MGAALELGDHEQHHDAGDSRDLSGNGRACRARGDAEVVRERGAHEQAQKAYGRVARAGSCQNELAKGATAHERGAKAHDEQAENVPQHVGVRDGLIGEAQVEAARNKVVAQNANEQKADDDKADSVFYHSGVTQAVGEAHARFLSERAEGQAANKGEQHGSMQAAGALFACGEQRRGDRQNEQHGDDDGKRPALNGSVRLGGAAEREALLQEEDAHDDAGSEADEADPCVQVAVSHAQNHAQGTAEEHEATNHHDKAQYEASKRRRAARRLEFFAEQRHGECAQDDADDFGAHVLHRFGGLQLHRASTVADKASDADGHVAGVAEGGKRNGE